MAAPAWYRLDNVGKFYASQAGGSTQTVFRLAAFMTEAVDADALQRALDDALALFPGFNVCLRAGLFWHYLEPAPRPARVEPETLPICFGLHTEPQSTLFRVSYYENRVNVEVSHIISDGRGSLEFFKVLLAAYVRHRYDAPVNPASWAGEEAAKSEDSFSANFDRAAAGSTKQPRIFRLAGLKTDVDPTYMELHYSAAAVHARAKQAGASVTSWLIAAVIAAIRREMPPAERDRAIHMDVPVDLRSLFGSTTLRNFFGLTFVSYTPGSRDEPLDAIAAQVQQQLAAGTEPDALKRRMMQMVKLEKNPLLRVAPLVLKNLVLDIAALKTAREVTTTVSSLGRVSLDEAVVPYVRGMSALTSPAGLNFILCTCGDDLCIGVSTRFVNLRTIRHLVRLLSAEGITGYANINKQAEEVDVSLRQAQVEDRLAEAVASWQKRAPAAPRRDQGRVGRKS